MRRGVLNKLLEIKILKFDKPRFLIYTRFVENKKFGSTMRGLLPDKSLMIHCHSNNVFRCDKSFMPTILLPVKLTCI